MPPTHIPTYSDTLHMSSSDTLSVLQLGKSWFTPETGGGLDRMFDGLMRHLPQTGVRPFGLVAGPAHMATAPNTVRGVASEDSFFPKRLYAFRQAVAHRLRFTSIDLMAAHFAPYTLPALRVAKDLPLVVHFHGPWGLESAAEGASWLAVQAKTALERIVYGQADRFIVLSEAFKDILVDQFDAAPSRIHVVPGGVDVDRFSISDSPQHARERLNLPTDRPIVLAVRRLAQRMGLDLLITAWKEVRTECPEALLLIAGTGPLEASLKQQIDDADLQDHIRLLGFVPEPELPSLYRAATLSVLPSQHLEGFGLTTIESLAAGTPVLVTPVGGLPEVVRDLSPDLILPDTTSSTLAHTLTDALTGTLSLPAAEDCQSYAEQRYSWATVAAQTRSVYEAAL